MQGTGVYHMSLRSLQRTPFETQTMHNVRPVSSVSMRRLNPRHLNFAATPNEGYSGQRSSAQSVGDLFKALNQRDFGSASQFMEEDVVYKSMDR